MKSYILGAAVFICSTGIAAAQQWYGGAYPDNWAGGPPLPAIHNSQNFAVQPQVRYAQPQVQFAQPQVQYAQPQAQYVQPRVQYVQPQVQYGQPRAVSTQGYATGAPLVQGPAASRCIVATLNGQRLQSGCSHVRIHAADMPFLRQKFSAYRPNSGYVLNLPSDVEYR